MKKTSKELIALAKTYFAHKGYAIGFTSPKRGVDLIVFKKDDGNTAIFVVVMDGDKFHSIPKQGLGTSKKNHARSLALLDGAISWIKEMDWKGDIQFDSLLISAKTFPAGVSHRINIGIHI